MGGDLLCICMHVCANKKTQKWIDYFDFFWEDIWFCWNCAVPEPFSKTQIQMHMAYISSSVSEESEMSPAEIRSSWRASNSSALLQAYS